MGGAALRPVVDVGVLDQLSEAMEQTFHQPGEHNTQLEECNDVVEGIGCGGRCACAESNEKGADLLDVEEGSKAARVGSTSGCSSRNVEGVIATRNRNNGIVEERSCRLLRETSVAM